MKTSPQIAKTILSDSTSIEQFVADLWTAVTALPRGVRISLTVFATGLIVMQSCLASAFQWDFTASLNLARYEHTGTLLSTGKVLVAGGFTASGDTASSELYDFPSGTWIETGNLNTSRVGHTATLLPDGRVLAAAGSHDFDATSSAEIYQPASRTWTATGALRIARRTHAAILMPCGKVLVAGGWKLGNREPASTAELYNPANGTWRLTGVFQSFHAPQIAPIPLVLLPNGMVLIEGGTDDRLQTVATAELYDPATGSWSLTGSMNVPRYDHTATLLPNGLVLVAGGGNDDEDSLSSAELYNPATGTWTLTSSLAAGHSRHVAISLPNGTVLLAGGFSFPDFTTDAELYDPATGTWSVTGRLNTARADFTANLLYNGTVLTAAGYGGGVVLASAELYDSGIFGLTMVNGRGSVDGQGDQATFNFRATQSEFGPRGSLYFRDPGAGVSIARGKVNKLVINGNSADFIGVAQLDGGGRVSFNVRITDNGNGTSDTCSISLSNGYSAGGTLTNGDIQIR